MKKKSQGFVVTPRDFRKLIEMGKNPKPPSERLQQLASRYSLNLLAHKELNGAVRYDVHVHRGVDGDGI